MKGGHLPFCTTVQTFEHEGGWTTEHAETLYKPQIQYSPTSQHLSAGNYFMIGGYYKLPKSKFQILTTTTVLYGQK